MRDPARIEKVLAAIREVWEKRPDLRLGQIIATAARKTDPCPDVFYVEDEQLVLKIQALFPTVYAETPPG